MRALVTTVLISGGVKLYIDGSGGARTAWIYDDWNKDYHGDDTGNKGYPTSNAGHDPACLIRMFHDAGHARAVARDRRSRHRLGRRHLRPGDARRIRRRACATSIIHANMPTDHAIEVMAKLQKTTTPAIPSRRRHFTWWIGDTYAGNFGPRARCG